MNLRKPGEPRKDAGSTRASTQRETWIEQQLSQLPRERASEHFTQSVLESVRASVPAKRGWLQILPERPWAWAALAAAILGAVGLGMWSRPQPQPALAADAPRLQALREEHDQLYRELELLRQLSAELSPTIQVSGDEAEFFVPIQELKPIEKDESYVAARYRRFQ